MLDITETTTRFKLKDTKRMSIAEWIDIPDCPFQRDTEHRAKSARHLKIFDDSHRRVALAQLPNGNRYKVDGHTRAHMWGKGLAEGVPSPLWLMVDIYECAGKDRDSLGALYDRFDNKAAAQTPSDITYSAAHELALHFQSPMLRANRYGGALKRLYNIARGYSDGTWGDAKFTYTVISYFSRELKLLDSVLPKHHDYTAPILMSAILTFMKYGEGALPFWRKYGDNAGLKTAAGCDGVQAMHNLLGRMRQKKEHGNQFDVVNLGRAVNAFERFRESEGRAVKDRAFYTGKSGVANPKSKDELNLYIEAAVRIKDGVR